MVPIVPVVVVPVLTEHFRIDQLMTSFVGRIRDLIVVDNGPCDWRPREDWAERVWHLRMPSNLGVAASWNLGIKVTPHSAGWMVVNHDVAFGLNGVADFFALTIRTNQRAGGIRRRNYACSVALDPVRAASPPSARFPVGRARWGSPGLGIGDPCAGELRA